MMAKIEVRNPRTGKIDYWITPPAKTELAQICDRLRCSQAEWQQGGLKRRIEVMQQWKQKIVLHQEELRNRMHEVTLPNP